MVNVLFLLALHIYSFLHFEAFGTEQLNSFIRGIYSNDVFIPSSTSKELCDCLYNWMQAYSFLAHQSFQTGLAMYPLYPKLHAVHKIGHEMRWQERSCQFVFNPATTSCSIDEDMVGRTAFLSRHVSPRQIIRRTLQRYVCHIQILWARL